MEESERKLNQTWRNMKYRCYSKNLNKQMARVYRDRGIKVCDEWKNDFNAFKEWSLANGYKEGLSIDRIDPDGDYEPTNCQWITMSENSRRANSREEKRFYVAKGNVGRYSKKFEPEEIVSEAMTYAEAEEVIRTTYSNDNDHYRVSRTRKIIEIVPPKEKPKGPSTTDRLAAWLDGGSFDERVAKLSLASKAVLASTLQILLIADGIDPKMYSQSILPKAE